MIGYPEGGVIIYCNQKENVGISKYFCKVTPNKCINTQTSNVWIHEGRYSILHNPEALIVMYRNLSLQDSGLYQCGENQTWNHDMKLTTKEGKKS